MLRPISLSQYYRPEPLTELVTELCDTNRYPDARTKGVDELVLSLVQRYALDFAHCTTLDDLRRENADPEEAFAASGSALRRKMESAANKHDHTGLPLSCLRDFRSSASLVREIAFGSSFVPSERGTCVDLGIGSGILSLGSIIALFRAGAKNVICHGVDRSPYLTQCSAETLTKIPGVDVQMIVADLRDASLYSALPRNAQIWTSETSTRKRLLSALGKKSNWRKRTCPSNPIPRLFASWQPTYRTSYPTSARGEWVFSRTPSTDHIVRNTWGTDFCFTPHLKRAITFSMKSAWNLRTTPLSVRANAGKNSGSP